MSSPPTSQDSKQPQSSDSIPTDQVQDQEHDQDQEQDIEEVETWYRQKPEWQDITPIVQIEAKDAPVALTYSPEFIDIMGYFRAILAKDERSMRAYKLTNDVLSINPGNYTVWYFRKLCIQELIKENPSLKKPILMKESMIFKKYAIILEKNYQMWMHRRWYAEQLLDWDSEDKFTKKMIDHDSKNYHAWSHRLWVANQIKSYDKELEYTLQEIVKDFRNNSAWNQRMSILELSGNISKPKVIKSEIELAKSFIAKSSKNLASWNYYEGLHTDASGKLTLPPNEVDWLLSSSKKWFMSPAPRSLLISWFMQSRDKDLLLQAKSLANELADNIDSFRGAYWKHISSEIDKIFVEFKNE